MLDSLLTPIMGGKALIALGILYGGYNLIKRFRSAVTTGIVVEMIRDEQEDTYGPVVEFTSLSGNAQRFEHKWMSSPPAYKLGQEVKVRYSPQNPANASIDLGILGELIVPAVLVAVGCLLMFI